MTVQQFYDYAVVTLSPTEPLFRLVPPERKDWKPADGSFTAGQLMLHMAEALHFNAKGIRENEWELPSMRHIFVANRKINSATVDEALLRYNETSAEFLNVFAAMSNDEFQTGEVDSVQLGRAQKWRIALFALDHHLNHKAELFMYLKLMGVNVTTKELYRG